MVSASRPQRVIVIGAGIGGLTAAALLAKAGLDVTVLEAHVYPGGCAGTFFHQGYRFDAGATLAAGFDRNGGLTRLGDTLGITWPVEPATAALAVHLPDATTVTRWTDPERWQAERQAAFGIAAEPSGTGRRRRPIGCGTWRCAASRGRRRRPVKRPRSWAQGCIWPLPVRSACLCWRRMPSGPWPRTCGPPPITCDNTWTANSSSRPRPLRRRANALYGAAALDMPRRGVAHVRGGIGALAEALADAVRRHGGQLLYRQRVTHV